MKLRSCIFKPPPSFKGFGKLICLEFRAVNFDADLFKNFISNCALLQSLTLDNCTEISCLEFNAPYLISLYYNGIYKCFCFKDTPLLAEVSIYKSSRADRRSVGLKISNLFEVFTSLSAVEGLHVDYCFLKNLAVPDASLKLQAPLNHLKFLEISDLCFAETEEVLCTLPLLSSSPNLRKLLIKVLDSQNASTNSCLELLESDSYMDFSLNQLQEVELQCFAGTMPEVELVKFLLAKSCTLKMMGIKFSSKLGANEQLKILKDLIRFKRASLEAEIIC